MLSQHCNLKLHEGCVKLKQANECTCRCHRGTQTISAADVGTMEDLFGKDGP